MTNCVLTKFNQKHAEALLLQAIGTVRSARQPNGSFTALMSSDPLDFSRAHTNPTSFLTSLIVGAVQFLADTNFIVAGGAAYLLAQQTSPSNWNYWEPGSTNYTTNPYPAIWWMTLPAQL